MYRGSDNYFIGTVIAKPLLLYSLGGAINTGLQIFLVYIGLLGGEATSEAISHFIVRTLHIFLPILPPIGAIDILNFTLNIAFGVLLAGWWTVKWSDGMSRAHR